MRLHRFYIKTAILEDTFDITDRELIHQWKSVFRYNVGSQVVLFDGSGVDYLVMITSLRNLGATVEVVEKKKNKNMPKINLWLCVGIIKKDNFEMVVQKATELGVSHIVPVLCERSEKKNIKLERLQKIAVESSEQSGRGDIPIIHDIVELSELLKTELLTFPKPARPNEFGHSGREKIVLHPEGQYIGDFLQKQKTKELAVFIGPEGGWSDREVKEFAEHDTPSISLGPQILRAETTAIAVSSLLLL